MRFVVALAMVAGCAAAGQGSPGDDDPVPPDGPPVDEMCLDTDVDGVCNHLDKCPGSDDNVDTDEDTVADGCDDCPMADDRIDTNGNQIPDCSELQTTMINVKQVGGNYWRGWYQSSGNHTSSNDNTITGLNGSNNYNSYFVFSLAGFTATTVQSVTLELENEEYTGDASETLSIWDVTTPASTVEGNASGAAAVTTHNDLGSGTSYGTGMVTAATPLDSVITIPLNAAAATDLKAKIGQDFAVGVHVDTQPGWVRFSQAEEARVARLIIKYL